jgi:hypothetical protein
MSSLRQLFLLLLLFSLTPSVLYGQQGFKVGIDFPMVSFPSGEISFTKGVGFGLRFPYGIDERLSIGANISGAGHSTKGGVIVLRKSNSADSSVFSDWTFGWFMVDAKYLLGDSSSLRPFVVAEVGIGFLIGDFDNLMNGFAFGGEVGLEHFLDISWSLNFTLGLRYTWFSQATISGSGARLSNPFSQTAFIAGLGATYHFY